MAKTPPVAGKKNSLKPPAAPKHAVPLFSDQNTPKFSKGCFWDMKMENIDFEEGKKYIISRVLSNGNSNDVLKLFDYYGIDTIKSEIVSIKYIDKKTLNYYSIMLNINKDKFRAYYNKAETWV